MPRPSFHTLRVSDIRTETADCFSVAFDVPAELADAYQFRPGQYLTLRTWISGIEVRRSYSICAAPHERELRVAIKLLEGGAFSTWAHRSLRIGALLDVMTPDGRFGVPVEPGSSRTLVAFAAGSGITPIMSIMKSVLMEERGRFFLFYGNRTSRSIVFRDELHALKDRYLTRLAVFHILSREQQDMELLNGRLDAEKVGLLLHRLVPIESIAHVLLCGPQPMIEGLTGALTEAGLSPAQVHVERFTPGDAGPPPPPVHNPPDAPAVAQAVIIANGVRTKVPVAADETIIEAGARAGLNLPYSCRGGMCCTCRAKVLDGQVSMAVNYSLEPWEITAGYVLTCQSRPLTPVVTIDYDHV